ncbi:hypothetical protein TIFTF001_041025 [Ficus carica]|uniref:Uncharacterized protein n=1 Tax=Ficus carica TaxID=3494 RepID=A0AA87Z0Y0_FICCA|nr:hypothetical protein TIFTF001_041025 [Ficus carica]
MLNDLFHGLTWFGLAASNHYMAMYHGTCTHDMCHKVTSSNRKGYQEYELLSCHVGAIYQERRMIVCYDEVCYDTMFYAMNDVSNLTAILDERLWRGHCGL